MAFQRRTATYARGARTDPFVTQQSFIYSNRLAYHWLMRGLYGRHFQDRYRAIAAEVPDGARVVDVCAGDAYLYLRHLRNAGVDYVAVDVSPQLTAWARRRGVDARLLDVGDESLPQGDVVIMQASLYQFLPNADRIVAKLLDCARARVIITEPIRNISDSENKVLAWIGQTLTKPARGNYIARRFNRNSFSALCQSIPELVSLSELPGGREMMAVFRGRGLTASAPLQSGISLESRSANA